MWSHFTLLLRFQAPSPFLSLGLPWVLVPCGPGNEQFFSFLPRIKISTYLGWFITGREASTCCVCAHVCVGMSHHAVEWKEAGPKHGLAGQ